MSDPNSSPRVPLSQAFTAIAAAQAANTVKWSPDPHLGPGLAVADVADLLAIEDDREFLEAAYHRLVHRAPDDEGVEVHLAAMAAGSPRAQRLVTIAESSEAWEYGANGRSLASIRAEWGAVLLAQAGSALEQRHLSDARWLTNEWTILWVDAVREVLPGALATEEDVNAFTTRIDALDDPRLATIDAWRAAVARQRLLSRWASRVTMRVMWRHRWRQVQDRFRGLVIFHAHITSTVNEPGRPGWRSP